MLSHTNEWGAIRVTVDHRKASASSSVAPLAVMQMQVGSELDEAGFDAFRRNFANARWNVVLELNRISIELPGTNQPLAISADAPWNQPSQMKPAAPRSVLEIDGEDVGRRLLEAAQ